MRGDVDDLRELRILLAGLRGDIFEERGSDGRGHAEFLRGGLEGELADGARGERGAVTKRVGEHGDVAVPANFRGRLRQDAEDLSGAVDVDAGKGEELGGVLGRDAGSAEIPAAFDVEADFEIEAGGLFECVAIEFAPAIRAEHGAGGDHAILLLLAAVGVDEESASVALGLHLFEVAGDGGLVGVAIEPPPVAAQARFGRRRAEAGLERIGRLRLNEQRYGDRENEDDAAEHGRRPTVQFCRIRDR